MTKYENRLELISPELSSLIMQTPEDRLRKAIKAICRFVVEKVELIHPTIDQALNALDSDNHSDVNIKKSLKLLYEELDETQWNLRQLVEAGSFDEDLYQKAFSQARAANALYYAFHPDPIDSALESFYESNAAIDDIDQISQVVANIIRN